MVDSSGLGFVARVKADGSLGFVHFPNLGGGIQTGFSPNSVVELPTSGLVLASTVSGEGDNPTDMILLGLDGNGRTMWGRARDGSLPDDSLVSSSPITPKENDVPVEPRDFTPALASLAVTVADYDGMLASP